jgi:hypothetical protein
MSFWVPVTPAHNLSIFSTWAAQLTAFTETGKCLDLLECSTAAVKWTTVFGALGVSIEIFSCWWWWESGLVLALEVSVHICVWGSKFNFSRANVALVSDSLSGTKSTALASAASRFFSLNYVLAGFDVWILSDGDLSTYVVENSLDLGLDLECEGECHSFNVVEVEPNTWSWEFSKIDMLINISCFTSLSWDKCTLSTDVNDIVCGHASAVGALDHWRSHSVSTRNVGVSSLENC